MDRPFIHGDFLLQYDDARRLYHEHAAALPIVDYHCHLPPEPIAADARFETITEAWLYGDHYKWRAMRANGVDERFCTGDASDWEKFQKWAETVPCCLRNPLYHWTHLELARYFGVTELLDGASARPIYERCNAELAQPENSCRGLIRRANVVLVCTTDDPLSDLEAHRRLAEDASFPVRVLPTWRPDRAMAVDDPAAFNEWVDHLAELTGMDIGDFETFLAALERRHQFFHENGCRLSDHGLEEPYAEDYTAGEVAAAFARVRGGQALDAAARLKLKSAMLYEFGRMDHARDWGQQFHFGALRNVNSRMMARLGRDAGFDTIGDFDHARPLARLLDRLEREDRLARTVLYNLNPADNYLFAAMIGNFQDGRTPGKIQFGSAWWFLDQHDGIELQLEALSQCGLLSRFIGMLTDSRSFLSYPRHEYFRRILCNMLGRDMERGLIPRDDALVGRLIRDVCYHNVVAWLGLDGQALAAADQGGPNWSA